MIIGIDLGTTNSLAAYMSPSGPQLIPNALGGNLTPSVVAVNTEGEALVGQLAREYQVLHPERTASVFKRYMGTDRKIAVGEKIFTPEQLSSLVLRSLKADAEAHLNMPISQAVITVPAYFNDLARKATMEAGRLAGLTVKRIINEPTAAAIAYGLHDRSRNDLVAVFDLGGGTFDISVVELFEGTVEVRASAGELFLGGEDFTRTIASRILMARGISFERAEMESPLMVSRLTNLCEKAKRQLTKEDQATVPLPDKDGNLPENPHLETVTRADFAQWTAHLLSGIEMPIRRCLGDAKLRRDEIQEVILVGGATRMPLVAQKVTEIFGREPRSRLNPDEVVALGAAVQAGLVANDQALDDFVVTDVAPFTLGIAISKTLGSQQHSGYFMPIIERNSPIPISRIETVQTISPNQTVVSIKVYQGEGRQVEQNIKLGELEMDGIPRGPAGQAVAVRFTYDLNGVLEVEGEILSTKQRRTLVITQHAKDITAEQLAAALEEMALLKLHPRNDSLNRTLIARGERLYQELPNDARRTLSDLLDGFESVLELGDKPAIAAFQAELQQFFALFEGPEGDSTPPDGEDNPA